MADTIPYLPNSTQEVLRSNLTREEREYVHSKEFKEKFGDWEKAQRVEKLKKNVPIIGKDITDKVNTLRNGYSKENLKQLRNIAVLLGKREIQTYRLQQNLYFSKSPVFKNEDISKTFKLNVGAMIEIKQHNIFQYGHIEAMQSISDIIKNSIYIGSEQNEDGHKPNLKTFTTLHWG